MLNVINLIVYTLLGFVRGYVPNNSIESIAIRLIITANVYKSEVLGIL